MALSEAFVSTSMERGLKDMLPVVSAALSNVFCCRLLDGLIQHVRHALARQRDFKGSS